MDHRRPSLWDQKYSGRDNSSNNPYHNQPTHSEYKGHGFSIASAVFGILSMLTTCLMVVPFPMAAFSLLFAGLAHRKGKRMHRLATHGIITSCMGIISAVIMLIQLFTYPLDSSQLSTYQNIMQQYMGQIP